MGSQAVVEKAKSQIGFREGRNSNGTWNNDQKYSKEVPGLEWSNRQPWCATFVCWVFMKTGQLDLIPVKSASCDMMMNGWKRHGQWSEYPKIGAQVFFGVPGDAQHTGIVVAFNNTTITTVEGNTNDDGSYNGNGVYLRAHMRTNPRVLGYGHPKFIEPKPQKKKIDPANVVARRNIVNGRPFPKIKRPRVLEIERQSIQTVLSSPGGWIAKQARKKAAQNIRNGVPIRRVKRERVRKAMWRVANIAGNTKP